MSAPASRRRLDRLTWRELEELTAGGCRTMVVPLGATEQHGDHLPLATDTLIADALAERFCRRVPEAIRMRAIALGVSREHLDFPGTLSLERTTLGALLADVIGSVARHGFESAFVFSAHGGNCSALAATLPVLRAATPALEVIAFADLEYLTARLHAASQGFAIDGGSAGHHAGEIETSILRALRPDLVRTHVLAPGALIDGPDAQSFFYPNLRARVPSGTVGDPTRSDPVRGEAYLAAWVDLLVAYYRREKKRK